MCYLCIWQIFGAFDALIVFYVFSKFFLLLIIIKLYKLFNTNISLFKFISPMLKAIFNQYKIIIDLISKMIHKKLDSNSENIDTLFLSFCSSSSLTILYKSFLIIISSTLLFSLFFLV